MIIRSVFPAADGAPVRQLGEFVSDHRSLFHERWGGWYVTGNSGPRRHLGNVVIANAARPERPKNTIHLDSLDGRFDTSAYLSPHSDTVALLVFEHQMHLMNLLSNVTLDVARGPGVVIRDAANEIADYMLFVDEVPLGGRVTGTSGIAEAFAARGPRDSSGRGLRQFDLKRRLMRYPCSYMIYSEAFDGLPDQAKAAIYKKCGRSFRAKIRRRSIAGFRRLIDRLSSRFCAILSRACPLILSRAADSVLSNE